MADSAQKAEPLRMTAREFVLSMALIRRGEAEAARS
jgi:hypothetical protein